MENLFRAIDRLSNTNDVRTGITSSDFGDADLKLRIDLHFQGEIEAQESWEVKCIRAVDWNLVPDRWGDLILTAEHVVLAPWTDEIESLYFARRPSSFYEVVGELCDCHVRQFGRWLPAHRFLRPNLRESVEAGFGMIAEGPVSLVRDLESVLTRHDMLPSRVKCVRWKPDQASSPGLQCITVSDSFVVAEQFVAPKLP